MKKLLFAAIALMITGAFITSCTKNQTMTAEPGTAMLSLEIKANTNEANDTMPSMNTDENVPEGTVVHFVINTKDLQENPDTNYMYDDKIWTGTVNANSMVEMELPAIADPLDVTVKFDDFEATRTWAGGYNGADTTETRIYMKGDETYTIWDGAVRKYDGLMYSLK